MQAPPAAPAHRPCHSHRLLVIELTILSVLRLTTAMATEQVAVDGRRRFSLPDPAPSFPPAPWLTLTLDDAIVLPGTTETSGKGPENSARERGRLTRLRTFDGPAGYQREIDVLAGWNRPVGGAPTRTHAARGPSVNTLLVVPCNQ